MTVERMAERLRLLAPGASDAQLAAMATFVAGLARDLGEFDRLDAQLAAMEAAVAGLARDLHEFEAGCS